MFSSDLNRDIENLKDLTDLYNKELTKEIDILNRQKRNHDNALGSAIQSRESINATADSSVEFKLSEVDQKLGRIKEYQQKLRDEEHALASEDADYEKYLVCAEDIAEPAIPTDIDEAIRFLDRAHVAVREMVTECQKTKRSLLARTFSKNVSSQRIELYRKIHNAVYVGVRIASFFDGNAWSIKNNIKNRIDRERQEKLMDAAEETQKIANMSIQQAQVAVMSIVNEQSNWLQLHLSKAEIETLSIIMDENHELEMASSFAEALVIGKLAQPIQIIEGSNVSKCFVKWTESLIDNGMVMFPAVQRLRSTTNIMLLSEDDIVTVKTMEALLYASLVSQPALRQRIYIIDSTGHGTNFREILPFVKQFPSVTSGHIITNRQQMKGCLDELTLQMDRLLQTVLINYDTVYDYNEVGSERPEPLTYICIHHFPHDFDDEMVRKLLSLMENGQRCGIQVVLDCDESSIPVSRPDFEELLYAVRSRCLVFQREDEGWHVDGGNTFWIPPRCPSEYEMSRFIGCYAKLAQASINTVLPLSDICGERYGMNSANMLSIPIGKNGDGTVRNVEFGDPVSQGTSHHALVFGSLGSGKSTLLHTIIMSAVQNYSPEEINLFLLDFKEGTEFKIYETLKIPHIKVLALDAMQEFGMSVLEEITAIAKQRLELFTRETEKGNTVKNISQYRSTTGKAMPRILVIMDEFQMLFNQDSNRRVANACAKLFSDIVALYRVCGIHCILATQTMKRIKSGNFAISAATMDEMKVRIGLKCDSSECDLVFKDSFGAIALRNMGEGRGEGVYTENVEIDEPHGFKVAFCDEQSQENTLRELASSGKACMRVFTGKSVPAFLAGRTVNFTEIGRKSIAEIVIGEPIRIDDPVSLHLTKMQRNSLFICGSNCDMMDKVISSYLVSCSINKGTTDSIYVFDGNTVLGDRPSERTDAAIRGSANRIVECHSVFDVVELINEIYSIFLERRRQIRSRKFVGGNIYVVINDLQNIEPLTLLLNGKPIDDYVMESMVDDLTNTVKQNEEDPYGLLAAMDSFSIELGKPTSVAGGDIPLNKKLSSIISSGHTCSIHVVVGCADLQPIRNILYDFLPLFVNRIVFAMNNLDAGRIIPDANLDNMLPNVALYSDGKNPPYQFKPYDILIKED